jgi:GNAT superfamily N-acetyltransferase
VGAAAGYRRRWRRSVRTEKPPRDRAAFPSVRFVLRVNRPAHIGVSLHPCPMGNLREQGDTHAQRLFIYCGGCDMEIISLTDEYKEKVERIVVETYSGESEGILYEMKIAVHRELFDLRDLPCLIALSEEQEILGYCYYRFSNNECEIMVIESIVQNIGIGSALINAVTKIADDENCKRVYVQTTNDNCHAFRFYQRRGFTICAVRLNELDYSRKLIPAIPLIGDDNIPALHEIEFEFVL